MKNARKLACLTGALLLTACAQQPTSVVYKGHQDFKDRSNVASSYRAPSMYGTSYSSFDYVEPVAQPAASSARVEAVGVKELAPPPQISTPQVSSAPQKSEWLETRETEPKNDKVGRMLDDSLKGANTEQQTPAITPAEEKLVQNASLTGEPAKASHLPVSIASPEGFVWPVEGKVISNFGPKGKGMVNDGINIAAPEGEPVWAASDGKVAYAGNQLKGYGNMVLIQHNNGLTTSYAHLRALNVKKGQKVYQNDLIGYVGSTGNARTPQLHFAVMEQKKPVNPLNYLPRSVAGR